MAVVALGYVLPWSKLFTISTTRACACHLPESIPGIVELRFCPICGVKMYKTNAVAIEGVDLKGRLILNEFKFRRVECATGGLGEEMALVIVYNISVPSRYGEVRLVSHPYSPEALLWNYEGAKLRLSGFLEHNGIDNAIWGIHAVV